MTAVTVMLIRLRTAVEVPALSDPLARNTFGFRSLAAMVILATGRMLWSLTQTLPCRIDSDLEHYRIRA